MEKKILAILEQRDGKIKKSSFETLSVAQHFASSLEMTVDAVVIGEKIENASDVFSYCNCNLVHFTHTDLQLYSSSAYKKIVVEYASQQGSEFILISNTSLGKDLAPRIAIGLNAGLVSDCTALNLNEKEIIATRPVYAGKALHEVKLNSQVKMYSLRPNVFKAVQLENKAEEKISTVAVENPDLSNRVKEIKRSEGKLDVAEADIIVSGGRGVKGPEHFVLIEKLAEQLGAAVGASRAVVDAGWRPHEDQVGQTGKTVSPSLYIACGISGAIQHLAGMSSSKYIVAINKDKDAPIFTVADYGIAGDLFEILPVLTEEIKKLKS
ncbi:MAG: electron transfer flavoprotein subunit alpha/FixB family protein [Ignavibacteriaceae bacterium]|jgi:electron transfer flavoprotein alpha subunit|nr:electron transfer flavoprotein subunit alpha/FixB family protein [Ignavibacteriaceae bacterium]